MTPCPILHLPGRIVLPVVCKVTELTGADYRSGDHYSKQNGKWLKAQSLKLIFLVSSPGSGTHCDLAQDYFLFSVTIDYVVKYT